MAASLLALPCAPATAVNSVWVGGVGPGSPYWDLSGNWLAGLIPSLPGDSAALGAADTTIRSGNWLLSSLSGTGTLSVTGGVLGVGSASSVGSLVVGVGAIVGGAGTMVMNNLTWNTNSTLGYSGSLGGATTVNGTTTLTNTGGNGYTMSYGHALNLNGDSVWNGSGSLGIDGAGTFQNVTYGDSTVNLAAGKTLTFQAGNVNSSGIGGGGTFNNAGTVVQARPNTTLYIDSKFVNTGAVNVNVGEVQFRNTRTLGGAINVASGAQLTFNGTTNLDPQLAITNAGTTVFTGTSNVLASGTMHVAGTGANVVAVGAIVGGAGTMVMNNLTWNTNSTLGYSGSLGGATTVNGTTTLTNTGGNGYTVSYGHALNLNGDSVWNGSGSLGIDGAGTFQNVAYGDSMVNLAAGKTLTFQAGNVNSSGIGGGGTFINNGTLVQARPNTTLTIASKFINNGTIDARLNTAVQLPANFSNPGTLMGNGTFLASGLVNNGHVAPGASTGTLTVSGSMVQSASGSMDIELQSQGSFDLLKVIGALGLAGTLDLICYADCYLAVGQSFKIIDAAPNALTGSFARVVLVGFATGDFAVTYDRINGDVLLNVTTASSPAAVPEPGRAALLLAGAATMAAISRRRRRNS